MKKFEFKDSSETALSLELRIAKAIKLHELQTAVELSKFLDVSYEAVRRELGLMGKAGLVKSETNRSKRGRPHRRWQFTDDGEHLFPKAYDSVLREILDQLSEPESKKTALGLLSKLADKKSSDILTGANGSTIETALASLYGESDDYISVEVSDGKSTIIERNCPILRIAKDHPMICSVSTNAISKALSRRIVRSEKFQSGHGRCVFVEASTPYDNSFVLESDSDTDLVSQ